MDAHALLRVAALVTGLAFSLVLTPAAFGATHRTANFVVTAESQNVARKVGEVAELYRRELAIDWLGEEFPNWSQPCPIKVRVGQIGAGGATSFSFDRGEVFGWNMTVQGTLERILDSVIPHEVSHTIFACHFRRPLPRWADEGAATLIEHESERMRQTKILDQVMRNGRRFPLRKLLGMTEYPEDMQDVLALYAQGYSLADFLVQQRDKTTYLRFLHDAHDIGWEKAIARHYPQKGVDSLEKEWQGWVMAGSPTLDIPADSQLADTGTRSQPARPPSTQPPTKPAQQQPQEKSSPLASLLPSRQRRRERDSDVVIRSQAPEQVAALPTALPMFDRQPRTITASHESPRDPHGSALGSQQVMVSDEPQRLPRYDDEQPLDPNRRTGSVPRRSNGLTARPTDWSEFPAERSW